MEVNRTAGRCANRQKVGRKTERWNTHRPLINAIVKNIYEFMKVIGGSSDHQEQMRGSSVVHRQLATKIL